MGFYLGASLMSQYEGSQQGISWATMHEGDFSFASSLGYLFFDIFFWLALAWYFDQVVPSEYGIQRKPWFLCTPTYWCGGGASVATPSAPLLATNSIANDETLVVEPMPERVPGRGVNVAGLRKVWPRGVAVHGLDLEMAPNQITGLLGANGAGKTTTISMLTVT